MRLIALSLLLCGCGFGTARNAFLELELVLPKNDRQAAIGERFANIRVATADTPFDQEWAGDNPIPPMKLSDSAASSAKISIEATESTETKPIRVKVRFCATPTCTGPKDDLSPETWLEIERAFYLGKRTNFQWVIGCLPNNKEVTPEPPKCDVLNKTATVITKCFVGGCRSGTTKNHCVGDQHFCER